MPKLSHRASLLPASPIRKLASIADAAKSRGIKVHHLNIGQPDIETPPQFFEAIRNAGISVLAYSPSAGFESLRRSIARYYSRLGYAIGASDVIVTVGASEALNFIFSALLNPGEEIIVPEPYYANYNSFSISFDGVAVPIKTPLYDDFAFPENAPLGERVTTRPPANLFFHPGNPTGILYPRESLEKLREICLRHNLFLIADEVYREFTYGTQPHHSILELEGMDQHAIVVDSISKRFSACGSRIGCVVSKNDELMQAVLKMAQARLSPPTFGQIGAEAVYDLPQSYYEGVVREYAARRDVLVSALREIEGVVCPDINGAFYAMVRLPIDNSEEFCHWLLAEFQYNGETVMLAPGPGFYATPSLGYDEVRIAYVLNQADLRSAMNCLAAGIKQYNSIKSNRVLA